MAPSSMSSIFLFIAFLVFLSATESKQNGGITLDLIHRDSPDSPMHHPSHSRFDRLNTIFQRSFTRKSSLQSVHNLNSRLKTGLGTDAAESPLVSNGGEYLMKVAIGTPPVNIAAIADTGSDLTWVQCKPCVSCYKQNDPIFDPKRTKTYRRLSCRAKVCGIDQSTFCNNNRCAYQVAYGDQSTSSGDLAADTFTFNSTSGDAVEFPRVVFGCGHQNAGTFNETGQGIIGLGDGPISIVNQLDESVRGRFSYCLTFIDSNVTSKINFGSNAVVTGPNVVSTPLIKVPETPTFYYLTLEGISVGNINKSSEHIAPDGRSASFEKGNIIIDSGTTLTFLPEGIYSQFEAALVKTIKGKRVVPLGPNAEIFNLCYKLPSTGEFEEPAITLHFTGGDLKLPAGGSFLAVEEGVACLTFLPTNDLAILGNLHQMNVKVGYDLVEKKLNFLPTDCTKSED